MPAVISDTTVINYLAAVKQAELLRLQFQRILVPPAVWRELHARNLPGTAAANSAKAAGWLAVQAPKPSQILNQLAAGLDAGEAEAIALACELKPAVILLDERDARLEAQRLGLVIIGTAGILLRARKANLVPKLKPLLDELIQRHGFRLSRKIYGDVLREAGELD